ncbi:hypothetical protein EHQ53_15855 [Leptospira langatensis]|uniref:SGNH/GDSL hydrolase family protein n=1 Tax=Leptospira langatensis TaxID=2484983 RepID=A0A5F1ZQ56_9LEPT|nr:hypothetical protein [Leptospira langatensis]TGK05120.1 hypothetical protein EHO57_00095 [Leptospira langatensis]TGL38256.1 hypothetical protein EHQ53_15855 [Leptospira langatensis]
MKFYLRLLLFFLLFLGSYSVLVTYVHPTKIPKQSWWQHNRIRVESFLTSGRTAKYVITGSSMSDRMIPDERSGWFNLSLVGEGALTGLSVLAHSDSSAKYVFIEVNQLSVQENTKFAKENTDPFFVFTRRNFPVLLSEKQPFNFLSGTILELPNMFGFAVPVPENEKPNANAEEIQKKLKEEHLEEVTRWYGTAVERKKLEERMSVLSSLLKELESKGIRPVFFEMPMHPKILISPKESGTREITRQYFPETKYLWYFAKGGPFEDSDGLHLAYPEANRFFAELKEFAEALP